MKLSVQAAQPVPLTVRVAPRAGEDVVVHVVAVLTCGLEVEIAQDELTARVAVKAQCSNVPEKLNLLAISQGRLQVEPSDNKISFSAPAMNSYATSWKDDLHVHAGEALHEDVLQDDAHATTSATVAERPKTRMRGSKVCVELTGVLGVAMYLLKGNDIVPRCE